MTLIAIANSSIAPNALHISLLHTNHHHHHHNNNNSNDDDAHRHQRSVAHNMHGATLCRLLTFALRSARKPITPASNISSNISSWTAPFFQYLRSNDLPSPSISVQKSSLSTIPNSRILDGRNAQNGGVRTISMYGHQFSDRRMDSGSDFPRPPEIAWQKNLVNNVNLIGLLGKDPEIKYFDTGRICARSSLAVRKSSNIDEPPSWFLLEFWNELAEVAAHHLKKGNRIHVAGRIVVDIVEGDDQTTRTYVKVIVANLNYIDLPKGNVPKVMGSEGSLSFEEKKSATEKLWQEYFSSPGEWWDNRNKKRNPKSPDFKHKTSGEALWIEGWNTPSWVNSQLEALDSKAAYGREQRIFHANQD